MFSGLTNQVSSWMGAAKGEPQDEEVPTPTKEATVEPSAEGEKQRFIVYIHFTSNIIYKISFYVLIYKVNVYVMKMTHCNLTNFIYRHLQTSFSSTFYPYCIVISLENTVNMHPVYVTGILYV